MTDRGPDSHCRQAVYRQAQYITSFPLCLDVVGGKSWSLRDNLGVMMAGDKEEGKEVMLEISLTGIKVTEQQEVIMDHSLKRISYATCDPASCLFSFMSRHPNQPPHLQQCHTFRLRTPCQAEELNTVVGEAFRAAYARQVVREQETVERRRISSQSADNILSLSDKRQSSSRSLSTISIMSTMSTISNMSTISTVSQAGVSCRQTISSQDRLKSTCPVTLPEYSQVFDMEEQENLDSMAQDSGISSTSDSSHSYSLVTTDDCLQDTPWYTPDIQRDLAMAVLGKEPLGSFMVRNSETQPGTLALSVRVPSSFHPQGITHYIINTLEHGYQIKGFLKVHPSLTALITHHSIMPELLPVPLNIHRHNPAFSDMDHDYESLEDFTKLMRDIKVGEEEYQ